MRRHELPLCLAGVMLAVTLVTAPGLAQVSPGPLAEAHRTLDGTLQCFQCHPRPGAKGSMDAQCLACHTEVAWMITRQRGFHARTREACAKCHPDHAGRNFHLVAWEGGSPEAFDHRAAGWPLEGKHGTLECRACHTRKFQRSEVAGRIRVADKERTWLGLEPACASCHADPHRGQVGLACASCHDQRAWKPASRFDHAKTSYPLSGKHADVECAKCHLAPGLAVAMDAHGAPIPVYKPLAHAECSACHRDPHRARFGPKCASCHVTDSFKTINERGFDHGRTRYPLEGKHAAVPCARCHDPRTAWGPKPAFARCDACHKDAHNGLGTLAGKPVDCAACHGVQGFRPSTFTVAQHRATPYPLAGRHALLECARCHTRGPAASAATLGTSRVVMRPSHAKCADCHADAHGGQLAARPDHGACEACHQVQGWKPSGFTAREHARLRVGLTGRHAEIACAACHGVKRAGLPRLAAPPADSAGFVFALTERECVSCHADPHRGRFSVGGARPAKGGCLGCHGVGAFRPSTMDVAAHATSGFALEGAHRAVPCQACHRELNAAPPTSTLALAARDGRPLPFSDAPLACAACHKTPHGDQFAKRRDRGACEACHVQDAWAPAARFDHDRDATFKLQGAHARTPCAGCHKNGRAADGRPFVIYKGTPSRCESCHTDMSGPGGSGRQKLEEAGHGTRIH